MTVSAPVKFNPNPPMCVVRNKMGIFPVLKSRAILALFDAGTEPSSLRYFKLYFFLKSCTEKKLIFCF